MKISPLELELAFSKCGLKKDSAVSFSKFLDVLGATRDLKSKQNFSGIVRKEEDYVPTDRSGGGV
jgi:hypothetical protein